MKTLALLIALLITSIGISQEHQVKIKGLVNSAQFTTLIMDEVNFQLEMSSSSGKGGSAPVMHYSVVKKHDANSVHLENALKNGKTFKEAQVWVKQASGKTVKYKLTNAVISDYSASFKKGKAATESFVIKFKSRVKM